MFEQPFAARPTARERRQQTADGSPVIRVAVVSPVPAVLAGLRALVEATPVFRVVSQLGRLEQRGDVPPDQSADVLLVDAAPGVEIAEVAAAVEAAGAHGVVLLGPVRGETHIRTTMRDYAFAYLPRDTGGEQLGAAIRAVAAGLIVVDPALGEPLGPPASLATLPSAEPGPPGGDDLTTREREVLQLVAEGLPNKLIARRLGISEHTVKFHVAAVLAKLGAASRTEAALLGARRGLVSL